MTSDSELPLPIYTRQAKLGDAGMRMVDQAVSGELDWIFRDQTRKDLGIDAIIEVVQGGSRATGRMIAAQVKCGQRAGEGAVRP